MGRDKFKEEYDIGKTMARKIVLAPMIQSTKDIISNGEWYVYIIKSMRWAPFYSNKIIIKEFLFLGSSCTWQFNASIRVAKRVLCQTPVGSKVCVSDVSNGKTKFGGIAFEVFSNYKPFAWPCKDWYFDGIFMHWIVHQSYICHEW